MNKRKIVIGVLTTLVVIIAILCVTVSYGVKKIPELNTVFLQSQLNNVKQNYSEGEKFGVSYALQDANIEVTDVVWFNFDIRMQGYGYDGNIRASARGIPEYNSSKKAFYYIPSDEGVQIESFTFTSQREEKESLFDTVKQKTQEFADSLLETKKESVFDNIVSQAADKVAEKTAEIALSPERQQGIVEKGVNLYLSRMPVYTLSDKGALENAVGIALKEVTVEDGVINIEISFWQIGMKVISLLIFLLVLVAMLVAMIRNPSAFSGLMSVF